MVNELQKAKETLEKYNQEHLLNFYNILSDEEKLDLIKDIKSTDFEEMRTLYENSKKDEIFDGRFSPINYVVKNELNKEEVKKYTEIGEKAILNNEVAIVTMAGGQGSRLGVNGPKGTYEVDINDRKISLFEIIYKNIKRVKEKYQVEPFWLIMTSKENDKQTKDFFKAKNYFNYDKNKIIFFIQNEKPILNIEGKLVLENEHTIKKASNGNGDVFEALKNNNLIQKLKTNGVKYIGFGRS